MNKALFLIVFFTTLFADPFHAQSYLYTKIEEALYEGQNVSLGPAIGFDCRLHYKSNSIVFADLNNDGISEGYTFDDSQAGGTLLQFINAGTGDKPKWVINSYDYGSVEFSGCCPYDSPTFVDITGDGHFDLVHGNISNGGGAGGTISLHVYDPTEEKFNLVTDTLWGIDFYDYSNIACEDFDGDGDPDCIVTNGYFIVMSIINLGNGQWAAPDTIGYGATNPSLGFLDDDNYPELVVSSCNSYPCYSQNISLFKPKVLGQDSIMWELITEDYIPDTKYTHPKFLYHNEDELVDLMVYENGRELLLLNTGDIDSANFSQVDRLIFPFHLRSIYENLFIEDINDDGGKEIISFHPNTIDNRIIYDDFGNSGQSDWYPNDEHSDPFILSFPNPDSLNIGISNNYNFSADFTKDGLNDLIVRVKSVPPFNQNRFMLFKNTGTNQFEYIEDIPLEAIPDVVDYSQPYVVDLDSDGILELLFRNASGWQHYEKNLQNDQWEIFSGVHSFQDIVVSTPIIGRPIFYDFDQDGRLDILTFWGADNLLSFYRQTGVSDTLSFELQPREKNQPLEWDRREISPETIFFTDFDNQCGKDLIVRSKCRGLFVYSYQGIIPEIISPNADNTFTTCDSSIILSAQPSGGIWGGIAQANGILQPSELGVGQFEATYTYVDPEGCYTFSDTIQLNINDCTVSSEDKYTNRAILQKFSVQPNPSEDNFSVVFKLQKSSHITITLIDILNVQRVQLIDVFEIQGNVNYNFSFPKNTQSGVHFIEISVNNKKTAIERLIKL